MKLKKLLPLLIVLFGGKVLASELLVSPFYGYGQANFYGQTDVPTYLGTQFGGTLEFRQVWDKFGLGIYAQYSMGDFENTNNNSAQKEDLTTKSITGGLKFYYNSVYLKLGYGVNRAVDKSSGTVNKEIHLKENMYQIGVGTSIQLTNYMKIFFELESNYSKYEPEFGGLTTSTKLINYMGIIGFTFLIPSDITGIETEGSGSGFEL